ncbi:MULTISPECIES: serine hydrolase domain-containing protein [Niastella]|uniref:Serine hydrolase n=1 Tax=Niastella soli TaxID=2821487 RepID=A0ABS3YRS9_9BACT|nr:serine hydrolase domain-containing protein [Niastella soli]MBO9200624.1 serine hydrolase [Niastella soli]
MKVYLFTGLLLVIGCSLGFGQLSADDISAIINKEVQLKRCPSIVVGTIDATGKRQVVGAGSFVDKKESVPDGNTMYEIGSVTKVFTTLLLADMVIKKQVNLDDPISKYLPASVKVPVIKDRHITLQHLASHSVGWPRFPDNYDPKDPDYPWVDYTIEQLYDYVSRSNFDYAPGTWFQYSNVGYGLLGNILSTIAGKPYETLVKERICTPLGLTNTTITLTPDQTKKLAGGHAEYGAPVKNWDMPAIQGTGAIRSDVNDLLTFAAANLGLVKTDLYPAMELAHIPRISKGRGEGDVTLGWTLEKAKDGDEYLWKDGTTGGYKSIILLNRTKKTGVVILANSMNQINDLAYHILMPSIPVKPYRYIWAMHDFVLETVKNKNIDKAIEEYKSMKTNRSPGLVFDESQLNYVANDLRQAKKMPAAIKILELNTQEYPNSSTAFESLGEAYKRSGKKKEAIENYEKAVQLDPKNAHAVWMLEQLKK